MTKRGYAVKRAIVMALSVLLALIVAMPMAFGKAEPTANTSQTQGNQILGKLAAEWWIWALEENRTTNPLLGSYSNTTGVGAKKCDGSNPSGVWFLAGSGDSSTVTRECSVPANTQIFFPVGNNFFAEAPGVLTETELRQFVNNCMDKALVGSTMFVTVDGEPLRVSIKKQRADTPLFTFDLPQNNIFGDPSLAGTYEAVADGVWVLLPPLSEGTHTITFGGNFPNNPADCGGPFSQDNTYILTVN
jgi:hypothetical protein